MIDFDCIMNDSKLAAATFKDIEKLYRLLGVYSGNVRQCEKHIEFIDKNFMKNVREPLKNGGSYDYDLLMTSVYFEDQEVFSSKNPEFTLSHALFCEGLKSLVIKSQITGQELVDWLMIIRNILLQNDQSDEGDGPQEDLASVLWRKNSPNIQIALYNQLMLSDKGGRDLTDFNVNEDTDSFEAQFIGEALRSDDGGTAVIDRQTRGILESRLDTSWLIQDERWQVPGGEELLKSLGALGQKDPKLMEKLRAELGDAALSDRAKKIIRFQSEELGRLRKEVEHLDQTQIDFNALIHYISLLEAAPPSDWPSLKFGLAGFMEVIRSVVDRFHPGLILFILRKIEKWSSRDRYKELYSVIQKELAGCLNREENLKNIATGFSSDQRRGLARDLLKFVDMKLVSLMVEHLFKEKQEAAVKPLLVALLELNYRIEDELFKWSEDAIFLVLPIIVEIPFSQRHELVGRALRNRSPKIRQLAVKFVGLSKMEAGQAVSLFERLDPSSQKVWLESILALPASDDWRPFVAGMIRANRWNTFGEDSSALFVRLTFKFMGKPAVDIFDHWVSARKFMLWPKFPQERETILRVALTQKEISNLNEVRDWAKRERGLLFQNSELKDFLSNRGGAK